MAAKADRRGDPRAMWPQVRSIVHARGQLWPATAIRWRSSKSAHAAPSRSMPSGDDYHEVIKPRLKKLGRWLIEQAGGDIKVFVDTAAVMEKPLAEAAGLGWQGKHTNLVSRRARLLAVPRRHLHHARSAAGRAGRAIIAAPATPASTSARPTHSRRHTGSMRGAASPISPSSTRAPIPRELRAPMGNRIYGCDDCLAVCPWNKFAQAGREIKLAAREMLRAPALAELARLDDAGFRALFAKSAVKRIGRDRFLRNVLIAIGNSKRCKPRRRGRAIARRCFAAGSRRRGMGARPARSRAA